MFRYLLPKEGPVIQGLESREIVFAKDQPQYIPIRALKSSHANGRVTTRWTLTDDQRKAVAEGADIFLMLLTFHEPLQPIQLATGDGTEDTAWAARTLLDEWNYEEKSHD